MTDASEELPVPSPDFLASLSPPEITITAVVTWVGSSIALVLTFLLAMVVLVFGRPIWNAFGLSPRSLWEWVLVVVVLAVTMAVSGDVAAYYLMRRRRWARWALVVLYAILTLIGVAITMNNPVGLVVCIASVPVIVMLFSPGVRHWLRSSNQPGQYS